MYDFRQSRDVVNNPDGTHTLVPVDFNKLDVCEMPVQVYYADKRIEEYWGHLLVEQQQHLFECKTPCIISKNKSDADVLVGMFDPPYEDKEWWQRTAVVNLEAHSLHSDALAATDILVSFHRQSDVPVNYLYGLMHGVPCTLNPTSIFNGQSNMSDTSHGHCLSTAIEAAMQVPTQTVSSRQPESLKQRKSNAVMFMSRLCNRHGGT